jgi:quinol monooxygenase YgiN
MSNDTQSPGPNSPNNAQLEVHSGWVRSGQDSTPGQKAYYINLEAKPGNGDKVEHFLRDILAGVEQEPGTGPWFGTRFSDTTFGIFEAFPDIAARNAHDVGPAGRTSSVQQNWKKCWHIPRTSIGWMSCSENSIHCSERRLPEGDAVDC